MRLLYVYQSNPEKLKRYGKGGLLNCSLEKMRSL